MNAQQAAEAANINSYQMQASFRSTRDLNLGGIDLREDYFLVGTSRIS